METSPESSVAGENRLLAALPLVEQERLLPHLERVQLGLEEKLYEPDQPITHVYFPCTSVGSLLSVMEDGTAVEFGTVGREGMVGLAVFLGAESVPTLAFNQVTGDALRMTAERFRELSREGVFHHLLHRYAQAMFNQMAQTAACNRVHSLEERCARWLLMTHDRVGRDQFDLMQKFLAQMLGTHRPSVSVAAGMLQKAGFIRYSRGRITVTDREGLESAACECYARVSREFDRLLP